MSADLYFTRDSSVFLLSFFFFRQLLSAFAERNSTKTGHMLGSKCDLKTNVQNLGCPIILTNWGLKNHLFWTTSQLNCKFNGLYLRSETWHRQSGSAFTTTRGLLRLLKTTWTLVYKRLQIGPPFYPPSVNSAFYFIARLRRRKSANGTQPHFAKRRMVNRANNLS